MLDVVLSCNEVKHTGLKDCGEAMNPFSLLFLHSSVLPVLFAYASSMGHFFHEQEIPNSNVMRETAMVNLFDAPFHRCSLENECNFVLKDTRSGVFSIKDSENDLPVDKRYLRIWRKFKSGKYTS